MIGRLLQASPSRSTIKPSNREWAEEHCSSRDSKAISCIVWTHTLRKSFRKVLNATPDLDEDTKEALMGHRLPGSRGNYFGIHDIDEIAAKYAKANFGSGLDIRAELAQRDRTIEELHSRLVRDRHAQIRDS